MNSLPDVYAVAKSIQKRVAMSFAVVCVINYYVDATTLKYFYCNFIMCVLTL